MKAYKISSKVYTAMNVPISDTETLVIPRKGIVKTVQFNEIPQSLLVYKNNGLISIEEV